VCNPHRPPPSPAKCRSVHGHDESNRELVLGTVRKWVTFVLIRPHSLYVGSICKTHTNGSNPFLHVWILRKRFEPKTSARNVPYHVYVCYCTICWVGVSIVLLYFRSVTAVSYVLLFIVHVSGITFIRYVHVSGITFIRYDQKIGKLDNWKIFESKHQRT